MLSLWPSSPCVTGDAQIANVRTQAVIVRLSSSLVLQLKGNRWPPCQSDYKLDGDAGVLVTGCVWLLFTPQQTKRRKATTLLPLPP